MSNETKPIVVTLIPNLTEIGQLCRLCLKGPDADLTDVFHVVDNMSLPLRIMACMGLEVQQNDPLPKKICKECRYNLEKFYLFRNQCKHTDAKLRRYIRHINAGKLASLTDLDDVFEEENAESIKYLKDIDAANAIRLEREEKKKTLRFQAAMEEAIAKERCEQRRKQATLTLADSARNFIEHFQKIKRKESIQELKMQLQEFKNKPFILEHIYSALKDDTTGSEASEYDIEYLDAQFNDDRYDVTKIQNAVNNDEINVEDENISEIDLTEGDIRYEVHEENGQATQIIVRNREGNIICVEVNSDDSGNEIECAEPELQETSEAEHLHEQREREEQDEELEELEADEPEEEHQIEDNKSKTEDDESDQVDYDENGELKIFSCEQCPKRFPRRIQLVRHASIHTRKQGLLCQYCKKWFPSKSSLERHTRTHTGEKPFQCQTCGRSFIQKEILKRHIMVHTGEKPFSCEFCHKSFTQKEILRQHVNKNHLAEPIISFHSCPKCPKTFHHASGLSRHLLVHTGRTFSCDFCGRKFNDKSALKRHKNTLHKLDNTSSASHQIDQFNGNITNRITTKIEPLEIKIMADDEAFHTN